MFIVGHTLVWHSQTPKWVFQDEKGNPVSRKVLLKRMQDHIKTVVGHYKGRINSWDVVNEVMDEDGTLRQSPWLKIIGPDYIEKAFEYAHKADPKAHSITTITTWKTRPREKARLSWFASSRQRASPSQALACKTT